ncbi:DUF5631 domain-containing protein [Mycobacterium sp. E2327]|uniref:DUF5631 domain-containing protein n=1 Tax=Mycobacterium sp. E2327 TaxID=1834132 RepID=UPI000A6863DE|nr:DUF5631 domain-containing protein [Mycobacterium sp. E2327]
MGADLPAGKYTPVLIGAWWPQPATTLKVGAAHWRMQRQEEERYVQDLRAQWSQLAALNQGHTVDDLVARFQQGEKHHLDLAEKYMAKADAFEKGADAIDSLRDGLRGIADDYNQRIANVENSKEPAPIKAAEIERLIAEANSFSAHKSATAVSAISDAIQKILTAEGISMSPQDFLNSQGLDAENPPAGSPGGHGAPGGGGAGTGEPRRGDQPAGHGAPSAGGAGTGTQGGGGQAAGRGVPGGSGAGGDIPGGSPSGGYIGPIASPAVGAGQLPGVPAAGSPATGGLSPAAALGGLSPNQLGQSFAQGMMTGQPAAAGAHDLSQGLMNATGASAAPPAQAPVVPPVAPTIAAGGIESAAVEHGSGTSAATAASAPQSSTGGAVPVATPMPVSAPAAPMTGGPAVPAGPLPAYGSDLRPPVVTPPAVSAPTTPVSGAPVAPSPSTSPSAGSPLMSTVQRGAAAQAAGSAATPAGASALSAATGALAGDVSSRAAEQQRLQRLVNSVARQAPGLSWAAGLRDDGTTLLVGSIGCGWIPPNVKIPVGANRLLEPALRRSDADVVDLLGAVTAAAVHKAHGFIAKPGPDDPPLTGDRVARTGPEVEELGPTLVEAVRRRDGLPRIAQTLAQAATRETGVTENEVDALQRELQAAYNKALEDPHNLSRAADWMLLAAVQALIEGHEWLAHYHVAWYEAVSPKLG